MLGGCSKIEWLLIVAEVFVMVDHLIQHLAAHEVPNTLLWSAFSVVEEMQGEELSTCER